MLWGLAEDDNNVGMRSLFEGQMKLGTTNAEANVKTRKNSPTTRSHGLAGSDSADGVKRAFAESK